MTDCRATLPMLAAFVADELPSDERETVRQHLLACVACRREAAAWRGVHGALRSVAGQPVAGVDEAMFTALQQSIVVAVQGDKSPASRSSPWLWLAAAALLVGGSWLGVALRTEASVWHRQPMATPAARSLVVPWSGARHDLRPLGEERTDVRSEPVGGGLLEKHRLRALVDEGILVPVPTEPR